LYEGLSFSGKNEQGLEIILERAMSSSKERIMKGEEGDP